MGTISTLVEITTDTLLASVIPDYGYQTYPASIQIKGVNTHFAEGLGTQEVWLSKDQETSSADSFVVNSNTIINAYFQIPALASSGMWDVNVECSIDGILTKEECFNILPPPAIIVVNPDSFVVELHNLGWLHWPHWMRFETLWPLLLVALGLGLLMKSRRPASA